MSATLTPRILVLPGYRASTEACGDASGLPCLHGSCPEISWKCGISAMSLPGAVVHAAFLFFEAVRSS